MGKRKGDDAADTVVERVDFLGIDLPDLRRVGKDRHKADQPFSFKMGDIFKDCISRNMQFRLDVEEIRIYGEGGAGVQDQILEKLLEELDIPD